jgi:hypothetical protein
MNRRDLLRRAGLATVAAPLAPIAAAAAKFEPKVDPISKAILDKGGRVVPRPEWGPDSLWSGEVWLENHVVGFIDKANGLIQLCTSSWPAR